MISIVIVLLILLFCLYQAITHGHGLRVTGDNIHAFMAAMYMACFVALVYAFLHFQPWKDVYGL